MKIIYIWLAILLLLLSSAGAFYTSYHLFGYPDGSTLNLTTELLIHTPFTNFYIPAILLFIFVGLLSLLTVIFTIFQIQFHPKLIVACGLILTVWMLVYMVFASEIYRLQYTVLAMGLGELLCGIALDRKDNLEE